MKHQALFSSKDKSKKLKCRLLQILSGVLRVNFFTSALLQPPLQGSSNEEPMKNYISDHNI